MSNTLNDIAEKKAQILHELRTPLNVILGYSEMIMEETQSLPDQTAASALRKIAHAGETVAKLINQYVDQLMNSTNGGSGDGRGIMLNKIMDSINQIRGFTELLRKCDLTEESSRDLDAITIASKKFEDLIRNL